MKLVQRLATFALLSAVAACGQTAGDDTATKDQNKEAAKGTDPAKPDGTQKIVTADADESLPSNTTGGIGKASLNFGSSAAIGLWLDGEATPADTGTGTGEASASDVVSAADPVATGSEPVTAGAVAPQPIVSGDCTIDSGFASIAAIKIKPLKDPSPKDVEIEKGDGEDDKADKAELDQADAEVEAAVAALNLDKDGGDKDADKDGAKGDKVEKLQKQLEKLKEQKQAKGKKIAEKKEEIKKKLKERREKAKGRDKAMRFPGPFVLDLVLGKMIGEIPSVDLPDGDYRRIEFKLHPNFDIEETSPLFAHALVVSATCVKGDAKIPVEIQIHHAINFRMRGDAALAISKGGDHKLGLAFDVKRWFEGIDLSGAELNEDGAVIVNRGQNRELWKQISKNIKMRSLFGHDKNGDGKVAPDEKVGEGEDVADAEG